MPAHPNPLVKREVADTIYVVWSGSQKVHPDILESYDEALEWKHKINDMGHRATIETRTYVNGEWTFPDRELPRGF
jgi:hypothetical protein